MKRNRKDSVGARKNTKQQLKAITDQPYRSEAVEKAADFIYVIDKKNRFLLVNKAAAASIGKTPKQIEGKSIFEAFPKEVARTYVKGLDTVFKTGKGQLYPDLRTNVGGKEFWTSTRLDPITNGDGSVSAVLGVTRGITKRKRAEEALRESEEKYRALVENSPSMIGIFQDGRLKYVNSAAIHELGWTYEELVSPSFDPIENVVSQKSRGLLKENIGKRLRGEDHAPYEITLTRKDGSEAQVLVIGEKITYNLEPAVEFILDDVTERERVEERFRQSEKRYHSLFDRMLDGVYLSTHEGRFVDVNPAFVRMFGYSSKQEMLQIKDIKKELYFSPDERGSHILDTGQEEVEVYRMRRKDGSEIWVEDHGRYIHDKDGKVIYHEGILRDITERKRTEQALRDSEEKFRTIFHNSPLGIFRSTFEGHLLEVNPVMATMFGYDSPESMIHEVRDVAKQMYVRAEDRYRIVANQFGSNDITQHLNHYRRKDGSEFIANLYVKTVRDAQGRPIFLEGIVEDITERKRLEEMLRASEVKYRWLFEKIPHAIYQTSPEGRVLTANPAFTKLFGYDSEKELTAIDVERDLYVNPEDRKRWRREIETQGEVRDLELVLKRKNGNKMIVLDSSHVIRDERGTIQYYEGTLTDITERKKMEDRLRSLHEHALKLASAKETSEIVQHTLDTMEFTLGFDNADFWIVRDGSIYVQDLRGKPFRVTELRMDGPDAIAKAAATKRAVRVSDTRREPTFLDDPAISASGEVLHMLSELAVPVLVSNEAAAILNVENTGINAFSEQDQMLLETLASHVASALARLRQQDELRRYSEHLEELAEERSKKLAESEARYRRLFESSPVALFEEDFSEVKKYFDDLRSRAINDLRKYFTEHPEDLTTCASIIKVLDVNETTLEMYGAKSVEEMRGELRRVFTPEFQDRFAEELVALGEGKTRFTSEFDNQTLNGDTRHVSLLLNVIPGYEDTLAKVLVAIIDLTERKKMEQRLQQAERLAAVGETAAMVGHDLRNPLQGIAGALHLLKQETLTANERNEILQVIEKSLEYADSIVRDLSDYSARIQLSLSDATPKSIIREAIRAVKIPPNVTVQDLSEDRPTLRCDVSRLRRVFVNLIENAIDAMPQGGKLTLNSRQLDGTVEIVLSDTGSAMAEKVMVNLWKPFQTTKAKGLGLGLSISKRIVDAHGGAISVESKVGEGTTITTCLPIKPEAGR